jgi:hypothetical protein
MSRSADVATPEERKKSGENADKVYFVDVITAPTTKTPPIFASVSGDKRGIQ